MCSQRPDQVVGNYFIAILDLPLLKKFCQPRFMDVDVCFLPIFRMFLVSNSFCAPILPCFLCHGTFQTSETGTPCGREKTGTPLCGGPKQTSQPSENTRCVPHQEAPAPPPPKKKPSARCKTLFSSDFDCRTPSRSANSAGQPPPADRWMTMSGSLAAESL